MRELLDRAFERFAGRTAVVAAGTSLTYDELQRATAAIASWVDARVPDGGRVVLRGEHTVEALVWAIGCLRSRGVYTPLSPSIPPDRAACFLEVAGPDLVLTFDAEDAAALAARVPHAVETVRPDLPSRPAGPRVSSSRTVEYSIFTSGTSGTPKLVDVGPGGLAGLAGTAEGLFGIRPTDAVLQFAALSFDASVSEILLALHVGARLAVPAAGSPTWLADVARHLETEGADVLIVPPSVYARLPSRGVAGLRVVIFSGEPLGESEFRRAAAHSVVFNAYGPTEATVCFSAKRLTAYSRSVGRPLPGFDALVRDPDSGAYAREGDGELVVLGDGVALGYAGHEEDGGPFGRLEGQRAYHTGDRVRLDGGEISFVGRADEQIKRLGHRLNLADLELVLAARTGRSCALVERDCEVVLIVECDPNGDGEGTREAVRRLVERTLAPWEAPDRVDVVDALPLTPHGKVDKAALRAPAGTDSTREKVETEPSEVLGLVVAITEDVLGHPVDPDVSVFAEGASSMDVMKIQVRLSELLGESVVEDAFAIMDFDFRPTDFATLVADPGTVVNPGPAPGAPSSGATTPVHGTSLAEAVRVASTLRSRIAAAATGLRHGGKPDTLAVTGVNGFVGGRVLERVLASPDRPGTILVVSTRPEGLCERHADRFGRPISDYDKVTVGSYEDLAADPSLGTAEPPSAVVHCGFRVNHRLPLGQQLATSIENTATVATASVASRALVLLSAASVGTEFVDLDEQILASLGEPYSRSKLVAESCVLALSGLGPAVGIVRAGLVYGHRPGEHGFLRDDRIAELLRACLSVGSVPAFPGLLPLCDVDAVVTTVLAAATHAQPVREVAVDATVDATDVARALGLDLASPQDWMRAARRDPTVEPLHLPGFEALFAGPGWTTAAAGGGRLLAGLVDAVAAGIRAT